jgi:XTP/dITP diphosphohydrolase
MANETLMALQELIDIVAKLRSPEGGCPWDLEQTQESLIPFIIEEAYEVIDAIQSGDQKAICEELGDLLLQVILQGQIAKESGDFAIKEIAQGISQKLIRRHPHVFDNLAVESIEEIHENWEKIKAQEKGETPETAKKLTSKLNRYRRSLPPLMGAVKISQKAAKVGFEWDCVEDVWQKFEEELGEFKQALAEETPERQESELGDLLFAIIQIARWYNLDANAALQGTNQRFIQRLAKMEDVIDRPFEDYTGSELEALWQEAKKKLGNK